MREVLSYVDVLFCVVYGKGYGWYNTGKPASAVNVGFACLYLSREYYRHTPFFSCLDKVAVQTHFHVWPTSPQRETGFEPLGRSASAVKSQR